MARRLIEAARAPLPRLLILLIGLHSCALAVPLLAAPSWTVGLLGFQPPPPPFFPSQSGVFLLILGLLYLGALIEPVLVTAILLSKALAVVFLVTHAAFLGAPPMIWAAAAGDGAMLAALLAALWGSARVTR